MPRISSKGGAGGEVDRLSAIAYILFQISSTKKTKFTTGSVFFVFLRVTCTLMNFDNQDSVVACSLDASRRL
jgi:hypothetical protein